MKNVGIEYYFLASVNNNKLFQIHVYDHDYIYNADYYVYC